MKTVFVLGKSRKYEGNRSIVQRIADNWNKIEAEIGEKLEHYQGLVGGPHLEVVLLTPFAAMVKSVREWDECDEEDQRVGAAHYLYQLYCARAIVKHLTESHWRLIWPHLDAHFWYVLGEYRCATATSSKQQLGRKLEYAALSFSEFVDMIG